MRIALLATMMLCIGCAALAKPPRVEYRSGEEARQIILDRAARARTITAQGLITLQRPDGQWIRLDLAMVRDATSKRIRLRAWKLGQAVFDFTMTPQGIWMLAPDAPAIATKIRESKAPITKIAEAFDLMDGSLLADPNARFRQIQRELVWDLKTADGGVTCFADARTLTPSEYLIVDQSGHQRFKLELSKYQMIGEIPFAMRYVATSDMGTIVIALSDVELNGQFAPAAFVPPRRAEKVR